MLVELGSSQVHSSSRLRQEFSETSSEMFLAAIVPICTVQHHMVFVCLVENCSNCMVSVVVADMHISDSARYFLLLAM